MKPLKVQSQYQSEPTHEVLDQLKEKVLTYVCLRTDNPRVADLANKLCDQIDESYRNLEIDFESPSALDKTAVNAIKFWANMAREDIKMNKLRPGFWLSVLLCDKEAIGQMQAYEEFIQIAKTIGA